MYYESENYLAHHGIKGQKWGVRRFQNPDGTRTAAGKKREKANRGVDHDKLVKSTNPKELYKNRKQLSDKELQDRLNRVRNEQALEQMANARKNEGKRVAKQILADSGKEIAKEIAKGAMKPIMTAGAAFVTKRILPAIGSAVITAAAASTILLPAFLFPDFMK